jgi:hypothetical protein
MSIEFTTWADIAQEKFEELKEKLKSIKSEDLINSLQQSIQPSEK